MIFCQFLCKTYILKKIYVNVFQMLCGHSLADINMVILEKVKKNDELYRKEREHYFIRKFNTYYKGLNNYLPV